MAVIENGYFEFGDDSRPPVAVTFATSQAITPALL